MKDERIQNNQSIFHTFSYRENLDVMFVRARTKQERLLFVTSHIQSVAAM